MDKNKPNQNRMGTQPLLGLIMKMSLPAMFSMLIQSLYNVVDSIFVGMSSESDKPLAAVSLAFPIQTLLIAFAIGTAIGTSSLVARRLGQDKAGEAGHVAAHGLLLSLFTSIVFAVLGLLFSRGFLELFENDAEIIEMGTSYLRICCIFCFGIFMQVSIEKILQGTGNMIWPMISQLVGAVTNLILDPILIFGFGGFPAMGVAGAAIATVAGQILAMIFCIVVLARKDHAIHISFRGFKCRRQIIKDIYAVGAPTIVMQSIGTLMTAGMNLILSAYTVAAYTVFGLYFKLQSFVFMPVFGLMQGLMPIMAFNYGAEKHNRVTTALRYGIYIALLINTVGMLLFLLAPMPLLSIFSVSQETLTLGIPALRVISLCFMPAAVGITIGTLFQAVGKGIYSMITSVMRQLVVLIPCAQLMSFLTGDVFYIWWAMPIADTVSLTVTLLLLKRLIRTQLGSVRGGFALPRSETPSAESSPAGSPTASFDESKTVKL